MSKGWVQTTSYFMAGGDLSGHKPGVSPATGLDTSAKGMTRNLANRISPVQFSRMKVDIQSWREAIGEAERAYYPHRVKMQRIYIDTILNGHVHAVTERRKELTLLRDYNFVKLQGDQWVPSVDLKQQFEEYQWFSYMIEYFLDAINFGYSLVSIGDIIDGDVSGCDLIKRWNISPDRMTVNNLIYSLSGKSWNDDDVKPWHIWVPTPSETGASTCGYGLFYKIALYEIFLRNTLGYNGDFVELYSQPYRLGKTTKTTESERAELEDAIKNMGSNGWALIDPMDEITFLETKLGGTGWQGYDNFEQRCMKFVSKIMLGHADGMDSTPGKLGGGQGEKTPVDKALEAKQIKDGRFIMPIINTQLLPRLVKGFGFKIPDGYKFVYSNDDEKEEQRRRQDASNLATAQIAQTMTNGGLKMDPKYFEERTGIPTKEVEQPTPGDDMEAKDDKEGQKDIKPGSKGKKSKITNAMNELYGKD